MENFFPKRVCLPRTELDIIRHRQQVNLQKEILEKNIRISKMFPNGDIPRYIKRLM